MSFLQSWIGFLGRALLSMIFVISAIFKLFDWQGTLHYFTQTLTVHLATSLGFESLQSLIEWSLDHATFLLILATIVELMGGLMVFLGIWVRLGAFLLFMFLVPTTLIFHHFWVLQEPDRTLQMIMFLKNLSIMGGLLFLTAYGRGDLCKHHEQSAKEH